ASSTDGPTLECRRTNGNLRPCRSAGASCLVVRQIGTSATRIDRLVRGAGWQSGSRHGRSLRLKPARDWQPIWTCPAWAHHREREYPRTAAVPAQSMTVRASDGAPATALKTAHL